LHSLTGFTGTAEECEVEYRLIGWLEGIQDGNERIATTIECATTIICDVKPHERERERTGVGPSGDHDPPVGPEPERGDAVP
jgi:hypothetical protein